MTLLETVVALTFAGIATAAVAGLIAAGILTGEMVTDRTTASLIARGQTESVLAQPYREDGAYAVLPNLPSDIQVVIVADPLVPGNLQQVTVMVSRLTAAAGVTELARTSTLKSNRFLTTGGRPTIGGLEVVRPVAVPPLQPETGYFTTMVVAPSATLGGLIVRWQLEATPPLGRAEEVRQVSISVYPGTPLGPDGGLATTPPAAVPAAALASASAQDLVLEVSASQVTAQAYTVYFFNSDATAATTAAATVACICPR